MAGRCECQRPCNCCTSPTGTIAVAGSGSAGQCFQPSVKFSTDAGNRARAGSDGAVLADLCASDSTGATVPKGDDGCLELPAAAIKDQGGDPIAPDGEGYVQLPANTPPAYGCGLDQTEDGTLVAATSSAWPPATLDGVALDGDESDGAPVYCEVGTGELRGAPEHTSRYDDAESLLVSGVLLDTSPTYTSPVSSPAAITNPSPSRRMTVQRTLRATVELVTGAGQIATVHLQERVNGGAWADVRLGKWPEPTDGTIRASLQIAETLHDVVDPGDTYTVELRVFIESGGAVLVGASVGAGLFGVTR